MIVRIEQGIEEWELKLATETSPKDEYENSAINYLYLTIAIVSGGFWPLDLYYLMG